MTSPPTVRAGQLTTGRSATRHTLTPAGPSVARSGLTAHADLLSVVRHHLAAASADLHAAADASQLALPRPERRLHARAELLAYRELLHALRLHAQKIFGPAARLASIRRSIEPNPDDAAAVLLIDTLHTAVNRRPCPIGGHLAPDATVAPHWLAAARALRAASDLVATHQHHRVGSWRTPESHLLDHRAIRSHGLRQVAALTAAAAADEPILRRRARTSGLGWTEVSRPLPDLTAVRATAAELLTRTRSGGNDPDPAARWLDTLTVARPDIGGTDVVLAWQQQLGRLRAVGWEQLHDPDASVATLADLTLAVRSWYLAHPVVGDGAQAWHAVHRHLRPFDTLAPADLDARERVHEFVSAVRRPTNRDIHDARLTLVTASTFTEIAKLGSATIIRLQLSGRLWITATEMTGDRVSDHPDLASAKLRRASVPARPEHLGPVVAAYRSAVAAAHAAATGDARQSH
jgi:hypothetical protein